MKLLHFGLFNKHEPQHGLRNAMKSVSDRYYEFSWVQRPKRAAYDLEQLLKRYKPYTVFMQIQTPGVITAEVLKRYPGVRFINFSGDVVPIIPQWFFDLAPYCTTVFTNTDWVQEVPGARYMQISCDLNIYRPEGKRAVTKPVVFLGNNHGSQFPLSSMRGEMVERFKDKPWFQVYGRGWGKGVEDLNYKQHQEAAVYRGAKIGINLSHMDLGSYTSDRMFRLMACGAMCLAYRHKGIEKEFIEGLHLRTWGTLDELEEMIEHYLQNAVDTEANMGFGSAVVVRTGAETIARNGQKLIHEKYNWTERLKTILLT